MKQIQITLNQIIEAQGRSQSVSDLETTAADLSRIVGKSPPWSARYLRSVINGTLEPSRKLSKAVQILGATLDDTPQLLANVEPVTIYAPPGSIRPGAVILGKSKPCYNPTCPVYFVPVVPWQKYCTKDCRSKARQVIS